MSADNPEHGCLILGRKPSEEIIIYLPDGDSITIIHGGTMRNGSTRFIVNAHRDIKIMRKELIKRG